MRKSINFIVIVIFVSCASSIVKKEKIERPLFYSRHGLSYEEVIEQYKHVKKFSGEEIDLIVDNLATFKQKNIPDSINASGDIYCRSVIDTTGNVSHVFLLNSLHLKLDSLAIVLILDSKFKILKNENGDPIPYSFLIKYGFYNGASMIPEINNVSFIGKQQLSVKNLNESVKESSFSLPDFIDFCTDTVDFSEKQIQLSNYKWEWASYISKLKRKLFSKWNLPVYDFAPGLTIITFMIEKPGNLKEMCMNKHNGNQILLDSSLEAIRAIFPLDSLPKDFPDDYLKITIVMAYRF